MAATAGFLLGERGDIRKRPFVAALRIDKFAFGSRISELAIDFMSMFATIPTLLHDRPNDPQMSSN